MSGRVAIVTGGLTGIGLAAAKCLVRSGHRVAVCSRSGAEPAAVSSMQAELGSDVLVDALDVASQESVDALVGRVRDALGPPQILVNAAGIYREAFLEDHGDAEWIDQIEVNLTGTFRMIRAVYPDMLEGRWGRIANLASTAGTKGASGYAGYCASKAGVIGLSKAVAVEGAPHGINCIAVSPTWVETPMMDNAVQRIASARGITREAAHASIEKSNPQNRIVQPQEIGELICFFCSDHSPGLTNVDIQVNAGADW